MPLPHFHLGPGLQAKAALVKRFSLVLFGAAQVVMDVQPLLALLGYMDSPVHGFTHTWLGAILVATLILALWSSSYRLPGTLFAEIRYMPFQVAAFSVFFGTVSHLVLDAWMHADMEVALLSVMLALPDMDRPGEVIAFSEFVAAIAFVIALLIWPCRLALVALLTEAHKIIRKERIPSL